VKQPLPHGVDLRGFRSRLAPLHAKLQAQWSAARGSLAASQARVAALAQRLRQLRDLHAREAEGLAADAGARMDAWNHALALRHLVQLARECSACERQLEQAQAEAAAGMQVCLERQRQLALVERIEDGELRVHAAAVERRGCREADLAWLARLRPTAPATNREGGVQ
jgi:hypothetical protein